MALFLNVSSMHVLLTQEEEMEKLFEDEVEGEDDEYENEGKGNLFATIYHSAPGVSAE